jgi:hypothetical protein
MALIRARGGWGDEWMSSSVDGMSGAYLTGNPAIAITQEAVLPK